MRNAVCFFYFRRESKTEVSLRCTYSSGWVSTGKGKKDRRLFFPGMV